MEECKKYHLSPSSFFCLVTFKRRERRQKRRRLVRKFKKKRRGKKKEKEEREHTNGRERKELIKIMEGGRNKRRDKTNVYGWIMVPQTLWLRWQRICLKCGRPGFNPWVGKIPWSRAWQPTLVFLPGESSWTEEPGGLQSPGSKRVGHDWVTKHKILGWHPETCTRYFIWQNGFYRRD